MIEMRVKDFEGLAKIRWIRRGEDWFIPIVDIAKAIDYDRESLHQIIKRDPELFEGYVVTLTLHTGQPGRPDLVVVTQEGANLIMMGVCPSRIKDEKKRQQVIDLKRRTVRLLTSVSYLHVVTS